MRFTERQHLPRLRYAIVLAIPPCGMLALCIWQVVLGHPWGKQPMPNGAVIFWTVFLWLVYARLLTVSLVTQVDGGELTVVLRGIWRARRIPTSSIQSVELITFDPIRDYGGYGIRTTREGKAYIAQGNQGVRVTLNDGTKLVIGSQKPAELAAAL